MCACHPTLCDAARGRGRHDGLLDCGQSVAHLWRSKCHQRLSVKRWPLAGRTCAAPQPGLRSTAGTLPDGQREIGNLRHAQRRRAEQQQSSSGGAGARWRWAVCCRMEALRLECELQQWPTQTQEQQQEEGGWIVHPSSAGHSQRRPACCIIVLDRPRGESIGCLGGPLCPSLAIAHAAPTSFPSAARQCEDPPLCQWD